MADKQPAPPPTFGTDSPVPQPLPPRKTANRPIQQKDKVPLFRKRGQLDQHEPRPPPAYLDVSEDDSDDELPSGHFARLAETARRKLRKTTALLAYQAQKIKDDAKDFGHKTFQTKKHLIKRFDQGATLTELIQENYSFAYLRDVLEFETIDDIVQLGLDTPLEPSFWDILIQDHDLQFVDLEKFNLYNVEEYARAGLKSTQLANMGISLLDLVEDGRFTKQCVDGAKRMGWNFNDYSILGLDYNTLYRMQFTPNEYKELFGLQEMQIAHYLGLYDCENHLLTQEGREKLQLINIWIK